MEFDKKKHLLLGDDNKIPTLNANGKMVAYEL